MKKTAVVFGSVFAAVSVLLSGCVMERPIPAYSVGLGITNDLEFVHYQGRTTNRVVMVNGCEVIEFSTVAGKVDEKTTDTMFSMTSRKFKVTPGFEFAADVGLTKDGGINGLCAPGLRIEWFDADEKAIIVQDALGKDIPYADQLGLLKISKGVVPEAARFARFTLGMDQPNLAAGEKAWVTRMDYYEHPHGERWVFDDIDAPVIELITKSPSADFNEPIMFRIKDATGVDWETMTVKIDGVEKELDSRVRDGDEFAVAPEEGGWKEGSVHSIEIAGRDWNGFYGEDVEFVAFTKTPVAHKAYSVRDDGMMLEDGVAKFPLGLFSVRPNEGNGGDVEKDIAEMAANGMNLVHTYLMRGLSGEQGNRDFEAVAKACEKHGMMLYSEPSHRKHNADRYEKAAKNLFAGRGSKVTTWWGIGDDTSVHATPEQLKRMHRFCNAIDPTAFSVSADVCYAPGQNTPYVPYSDVFMMENYPIRETAPADDELAKGARQLDYAWASIAAAKVKGHTVMAIPQAFSGWTWWKRYPTIEEIRVQAYIAIACRARGICYYTSYGIKGNKGPFNDAKTKEEFLGLMRELAAISPSLVKFDAEKQPEVKITAGDAVNVLGGPSIRVLLKEDGLLIAANTSHKPVTAEFTLPDGRKVVHTFERNGVLVEKR